jgi:hypothetical protein
MGGASGICGGLERCIKGFGWKDLGICILYCNAPERNQLGLRALDLSGSEQGEMAGSC